MRETNLLRTEKTNLGALNPGDYTVLGDPILKTGRIYDHRFLINARFAFLLQFPAMQDMGSVPSSPDGTPREVLKREHLSCSFFLLHSQFWKQDALKSVPAKGD